MLHDFRSDWLAGFEFAQEELVQVAEDFEIAQPALVLYIARFVERLDASCQRTAKNAR
jgi:hypothetical protein